MVKEYFARRRKVTSVGDSEGVTLPKDEVEELPDDVEARVWKDEEEGILGVEVPLDGGKE